MFPNFKDVPVLYFNKIANLTEFKAENKLRLVNFLPNGKLLDQPILKAFADDNFKVAQMVQFFFDRVENIVGKGENAGYHQFFLFPQCTQKSSF